MSTSSNFFFRQFKMCCLHSQCSSGQIQVESPTSNRLLPPAESAPASAAAADAVQPPSTDVPPTQPHQPPPPSLPPPPPPPPSNPPACESCIYRVCGCQIPPPSDRSTTEMESSLDVDLTDPRVVQALTIFGGGDVWGHDDVIDLTPKDLDERLNRIDFVSAYFQNYGHRVAAKESNPDYSTRNPDKENLAPVTTPGGLLSSSSTSPPIRDHHGWSSDDVSSSLPSSFQPDCRVLLPPRKRRILAPTNSPVSGRADPSLGTEDSGGDRREVLPERLRKEFSYALGFLFDGRNNPERNTARTSAVKRRSQQQHPPPRKTRRTSVPLGDRPPCLGQEQSPIRDNSPCVGGGRKEEEEEDNRIPSVKHPVFRLIAMTPNDVTMVTPSPNYSPHRNHDADYVPLPTVRPIVTDDANGGRGETKTLPSLSFRPPKSSAEKVRRWLTSQQETCPSASSCDNSCPSSSESSFSRRKIFDPNQVQLSNRRLPKRRSHPVQRCYHRRYSPKTDKRSRDPEEEQEDQDRTPVFLLHRIPYAATSAPHPPSDEISSSGFLADRSSTTRSSLRTASDHHVSPSSCGPHDSNPERQSGANLLWKV